MSALDLVLYHVSPWLFAAGVAAPFLVRAFRRLPVDEDLVGTVDRDYVACQRRGMEARRGR